VHDVQVAERQGRYVAECLNSSAHGHRQTMKPFHFQSMGMLAYIGGYSALTDTPELKLKGAYALLSCVGHR